MRFWDSSAIAPLLVVETTTEQRKEQLRADPEVAVWYGTPVEIESALCRRRREGHLSIEGEGLARERFQRLSEAWHEIGPTLAVRREALRLLNTHPLRAADALQLAAAIELFRDGQNPGHFYTNDLRLSDAAAAEGFIVR